MSVKQKSYKVDSYSVEIYGADTKGKRTRWGDKIIKIYSEGLNVGQAVFASEGKKTQEPYYSEGKIYYFAPGSQFNAVLDLLRTFKPVYFAWRPVYDTKEAGDGDAVFYTEETKLNNKA
jgi:hypothetical protein